MKKYGTQFLFLVIFSATIFLLGEFIPSTIGHAGILLLFIVIMVFNLIKEILLFVKTRKGVIVDGTLLLAKRSKENLSYEVEIKYNSTINNKEYILRSELVQLKQPSQAQPFKVWVNETNPEKSVLLNRFSGLWRSTIIIGIGLIVFFSYWLLKTII